MAHFVEHYLCDTKVMGYKVSGKGGDSRMPEVDRKRFFIYSQQQAALAKRSRKTSGRQDQKTLQRSDSCGLSIPLYSQGLISNRLLQRKQRSLRSQS